MRWGELVKSQRRVVLVLLPVSSSSNARSLVARRLNVLRHAAAAPHARVGTVRVAALFTRSASSFIASDWSKLQFALKDLDRLY